MLRENINYKVLTPTGFKSFSGVQKLEKEGYRFECANGKYCEVSHGHTFVVDGVEILSDDVHVGSLLQYKDDLTRVVKKINTPKNSVYDLLDVDGGNLYYGDGFLHHNCEFIGSSETIIEAAAIERLLRKRREPEGFDMGGKFRIWEKPKQGAIYVLGVDTSKGVGGDSSVIQVIKVLGVNPIQLRQVAVWEDNYTDVYKFAEVVNRMSYYYNDAYMMVENNAEGSVVVQRLWWEYENQNLINTGGKIKDLGIRATGNTKPRAVFLMKKIIEDQMIDIPDDRTVGQLADFQDLGNNKFGGVNINDDCVSSLYWAMFILEMNIFDESWTFSEENLEEDDFWGDIFADWQDEVAGNEDWSWLTEE